MTTMIDIKVKDQFSHIFDAKALLRQSLQQQDQQSKLLQNIEHIIVNDEIILPSIELLFESKNSDNIYRVIE